MRTIIFWLTAVGGAHSAAFAQTTLNMSQDLVPLGIASTNMVANQPGLDAGPLFFRAVNYAQAHQIGRVIADTGAYYFRSLQFSGAHVAWDQLSNLTIDLQGSDLYFSFPLTQGILITHSTNIVFENFTADYDPLPFTQVRVLSVDPAQQRIQYAVDGNWQNPSVLNAVFPFVPNAYGFGVEVHMFRNGRPIPGVTRLYAANPIGSTQFTATPDPGVNPSALFAQIRPGDIAFLGMRWGAGPFSVLYCTGCTFRNIAVYSGTQWGFLAAHMQSSVFERIYSVPRPATGRLASNYVGVLLTDVGPSNQIRLNRMIRSMDDGLEYDTSFLGTVKSQTDNRTFVLEGSVTTKLSYGDSVPNGSPVAFQRLSDGAILTSAAIVSQVAPKYTGQNPYQVTYTFDRDLPASIVGTLMLGTDLNQRGGNSMLERNALEEETDCCAGFLVAGLLNGIFRGNYIQRSGMTGLHTENSMQPGNFDLPPTESFTISNNVIDAANWTRTSYPTLQLGSIQIDSTYSPRIQTASPNQNISITSNFIADSGSAAVWLGNTNGGLVSGNYFLNPDSNPAVVSSVAFFGPSQPLVVQASQNVATGNNLVDQTSGRMWVTDSRYRELAAYAPGSSVRLNAYRLGTLFPSPSVTLTDADGNTTPLTILTATAHAMDVQIPASAGLGGAYVTLTSGGIKYFGTLFLDGLDNIPALNGCTYQVSLSSPSAGAAAGNFPILVVTQAGCAYQVLTSASFVTAGAGGTGTDIIAVGLGANTGAARTTTIEIAGQVFTLTQDAPSNGKPPASIKAIAGNGQSGPAGLLLPNPVVVEVADSLGNPVPRATVTFAGTNAVVSPAAVQTDSSGRASALVTLGAGLGPANVTATVAGLAALTFNFTATEATTTIKIQKTSQAASAANPLRGDTFTYSIKVTNSGLAPAAAVNVQDTPDTRTELALQGPVNFNLGTLAPGSSQTLTIKASASAVGTYINNATVTWSDNAGKSASSTATASTTVDRQPDDLSASLKAPVPLGTGVQQVLADGMIVYVVNNPGDSLTILNCASGACTITSTLALGTGAQPVAIARMDVDGDGQNDILILNQGAGTIATLLSSNAGALSVSSVGAGAVAMAPFNAGDGLPRIAVAFSGGLTIFAWDGQQFQPGASAVTGGSPSVIANGDFNGDGADDLLVTDAVAGTVQIFLGDGSGGLNLASTLPVGANPAALAVGDVNKDGALDAVVMTGAGLVVLLNDAAGNLTPQSVLPTPGAGAVVLADFNGDGYLDAAVANRNGSSVNLYRGDGSATFTAAGSYLSGNRPVSLATSDLNNNGTTYLISASSGSRDLTLLLFSNADP